LQRLRPDVLITWGPDGGYGHPDHRIVSSIVTQLVRAGAPGVPQRVFYASIPAEGTHHEPWSRGATVLDTASQRIHDESALHACRLRSRTPFDGVSQDAVSDEAVARTTKAMEEVWKGELPLSPMVPQPNATDVFQ
jgi:LmbE family N-acetylglucosaminyl deacetylase